MTGADLTVALKKHPLGVACAVVILVCAGLLYYRSENIAASQKELDERTAEANKMIANVRNSAGLAEQVAEIQEQRKEIESRLLKWDQLAVNLQYFYKLQTETGVRLAGDPRQNAVQRYKAYVGVPFSMTVEGTYSQLVNFLNRLQQGRHFCRIGAANFGKGGGVSEGGSAASDSTLTLTLNLELLGHP